MFSEICLDNKVFALSTDETTSYRVKIASCKKKVFEATLLNQTLQRREDDLQGPDLYDLQENVLEQIDSEWFFMNMRLSEDSDSPFS